MSGNLDQALIWKLPQSHMRTNTCTILIDLHWNTFFSGNISLKSRVFTDTRTAPCVSGMHRVLLLLRCTNSAQPMSSTPTATLATILRTLATTPTCSRRRNGLPSGRWELRRRAWNEVGLRVKVSSRDQAQVLILQAVGIKTICVLHTQSVL